MSLLGERGLSPEPSFRQSFVLRTGKTEVFQRGDLIAGDLPYAVRAGSSQLGNLLTTIANFPDVAGFAPMEVRINGGLHGVDVVVIKSGFQRGGHEPEELTTAFRRLPDALGYKGYIGRPKSEFMGDRDFSYVEQQLRQRHHPNLRLLGIARIMDDVVYSYGRPR